MNYRQIISRRLYVCIDQFYPSKELVHLLAEHFETAVDKLNNVDVIHFHGCFSSRKDCGGNIHRITWLKFLTVNSNFR